MTKISNIKEGSSKVAMKSNTPKRSSDKLKTKKSPKGSPFVGKATPETKKKATKIGKKVQNEIGTKKLTRREEYSRRARQTSRSVFVAHLPDTATIDQIKEAFTQFGKVADVVLPFRKTLRQKQTKSKKTNSGYGFVTFEKETSVGKAVSKSLGVSVEGTAVFIKRCDVLDSKHPSIRLNQIKVEGSHWSVTRDQLKAHFEKFGEVIHSKVRGSKGFIAFNDEDCVKKAIEETTQKIGSDRVVVSIDDGRRKKMARKAPKEEAKPKAAAAAVEKMEQDEQTSDDEEEMEGDDESENEDSDEEEEDDE